jgi:hypothetical protein
MIAQIDKEQVAVITFAVDPPRQTGRPSRIGEAQRSAGMGSIGVHLRLVRRGVYSEPVHGMERRRLSRQAPRTVGQQRV